jgi:hypothetical protein
VRVDIAALRFGAWPPTTAVQEQPQAVVGHLPVGEVVQGQDQAP